MDYLNLFAKIMNVEVRGLERTMPVACAGDISMINFRMGSANAATIMDLISAIQPKAVLFLGKCGGLKKKK
jgi:AMP nucleosidase